MITLPDGSGVLLCPTGNQFSTISDLEYASLEEEQSNGYGSIQEIDVSIFQEWFSNAKEIKFSQDYDYSSDQDFDESLYESSYDEWYYMQGVYVLGDGEFNVEFNDSPNPFPKMVLEYDDILLLLGSPFGLPFQYIRVSGQDENTFLDTLPRIFIRNDKFYWFRYDYPKTETTLTDTELKFVFTDTFDVTDLENEDEQITITSTFTFIYRITNRFYWSLDRILFPV